MKRKGLFSILIIVLLVIALVYFGLRYTGKVINLEDLPLGTLCSAGDNVEETVLGSNISIGLDILFGPDCQTISTQSDLDAALANGNLQILKNGVKISTPYYDNPKEILNITGCYGWYSRGIGGYGGDSLVYDASFVKPPMVYSFTWQDYSRSLPGKTGKILSVNDNPIYSNLVGRDFYIVNNIRSAGPGNCAAIANEQPCLPLEGLRLGDYSFCQDYQITNPLKQHNGNETYGWKVGLYDYKVLLYDASRTLRPGEIMIDPNEGKIYLSDNYYRDHPDYDWSKDYIINSGWTKWCWQEGFEPENYTDEGFVGNCSQAVYNTTTTQLDCINDSYGHWCQFIPTQIPYWSVIYKTRAYGLTQCGALDEANKIYTLENDLNSNETCLIITADNVTINGAGYSIIGNGINYGIQATNVNNLAIKNITIANFLEGIYLDNVKNSLIEKSIVNLNLNGISLVGDSDDVLLMNNNLFGNANLEINDITPLTNINHLIYNNQYGQISWKNDSFLGNLTLKGNLTFPENIKIENNSIFFDPQEFLGLINSQSDIILNNILGFVNPDIFKDGSQCIDCTFGYYDGSTASFSINGWGSTYTISEAIIPPTCGDGTCNGEENCSSCSADCGNCSISYVCGDGNIDAGETCSNCPADVGACAQQSSGGGIGGSHIIGVKKPNPSGRLFMVDLQDTEKLGGISKLLRIGDVVQFKVKNGDQVEQHQVVIMGINSNIKTTLKIQSQEIIEDYSPGKIKEYDLTGDKFNDVEIGVSTITDEGILLNIHTRAIAETSKPNENTKPADETIKLDNALIINLSIGIGTIILLALIIVLILKIRKKK